MSEDVQIIHGDCLDVLPTLEAGSVDAVITDPPCGVGFGGKNTKHTKRELAGYGEFDDTEEYVASVVVPIVEQCIEKFGRVVVTPGTRCMHLYPKPDDVGCIYCPSGAGLGRWGFICFQPVLYYGKDPYLASGKGHRPNGFSSTASAETNGHPCPKPFAWMKWLVEKATFPGETVLDPFAGSGTTAVACVKTGRRCIAIEREAKYVEIIRRRVAEARAAVSPSYLGSAWVVGSEGKQRSLFGYVGQDREPAPDVGPDAVGA